MAETRTAEARLYMFDDAIARQWQPFALTRPAGELMLGAYTFRARAERIFGVRCAGHVTAPHLLGFDEPDSAQVVDLNDIPTNVTRIFVSSRAVPAWAAAGYLRSAARESAAHEFAAHESASSAVVFGRGDHVIGCVLPVGAPNPGAEWIDAPSHDVAGARMIEIDAALHAHVWDLVGANSRQLVLDIEQQMRGGGSASAGGGMNGPAQSASRDAPRCEMIAYSDGMLQLGENVVIEPNTVLDFSHGPIRLDDGVTIRAFTRLAGPAYVGRNSTLLGGPYEAVSIGPVCRVHGEVEESVVLGWSNKAHDGFLGHAYLGRWVNLGALTTNSDLKNNYGTIRMWTPNGDADTGLIKLGCLLGDHVKTGIGALINTGTVIGAGSNIFGTTMPPKYVEPFSWGSGSDLVAYDVDRFLDVTATVMGRRDVELSDGMRNVLRAAWQSARGVTGGT